MKLTHSILCSTGLQNSLRKLLAHKVDEDLQLLHFTQVFFALVIDENKDCNRTPLPIG